jgi:NAD(P)-dependent dehydrogenase (short-subunit alcohol dehydrogenase family)
MAIPDLKQQRVLITGAGSGIGRSCASAFARRGAQLIISDINAGALEQTRQEVLALGASCIAHVCNVADEASVQALAAAVGMVDVLVNNAGIGYLGSFLDTPLPAWQRVMDVNVMGMVHMCRAFLPAMQASGRQAAIVNVASTAGFAPAPTMAAYAASKHAVVGLSEVLAMELAGTPVTVTIVAPGIIATNIVNVRANVSTAIPDAQLHKLQAYYDANGAEPALVAEDIVRAVQRGQAVLETGPYARLACGVMRLSRRLARRLTLASASKFGYL